MQHPGAQPGDNTVASTELSQAARPACRVCLEEDGPEPFCRPCACSGSMGWAHPACIQHWIDVMNATTCEICRQQYVGGFRPPPRLAPEPRGSYEDPHEEQASALWCLAAVLVFAMLLLLRHALEVFTDPLQPRDAPGSDGERADWRSHGDEATGWDPTLAGHDPPLVSPGARGAPEWEGEGDVSVWLVLAWLAVRVAAVLVPVLLALRLMAFFHSASEAQLREAEGRHAAALRVLEAGGTPRPPQPAAGPPSAVELVSPPRGRAASLQPRSTGGVDGGAGRSRSL